MTDSPQGLVAWMRTREDGETVGIVYGAPRPTWGKPEEWTPLYSADRIEALEREKAARNAIDPMTRLHNLCDGLAEHRRESPYDEESWRLADESFQKKCAELTAAQAALREAQKDAERYLDALKWVDLQLSDTPLFLRIEGHNALANVMDEVFGKVRAAIDAARKVGTPAP